MLGEVIGGRYRLLSQIGEGGHGIVYRAEQIGFSRPVALKLMQEERLEAGLVERFLREAELAQRLCHPNTVRLLDYGIHEGALPFMVFELLEGRSLRQALKSDGPMPARRVAHISSQILRALSEAHQAGIIHRDIKPANVFLCPVAGDPDFTKLLDFGIAKSLRPATKALTAQGEILGTPSYMAPEHIEARPIAPSTDLYSLALVMSELMSGRRVYSGSAIDVCLQQVSHSPAPLPPEVTSSPLGPVIARASSKRMEQRFSSATEMLAAIEEAVMRMSMPSMASLTSSNPSLPAAFTSSNPSLPAAFTSSSPSLPAISTSHPSLPGISSPALPVQRSYALHLVLGAVALALAAGIVVALYALVLTGRTKTPPAPSASMPPPVEIRPVE